MIRTIVRAIAEFGAVACTFCSLDGMYLCGENFLASMRSSAACDYSPLPNRWGVPV